MPRDKEGLHNVFIDWSCWQCPLDLTLLSTSGYFLCGTHWKTLLDIFMGGLFFPYPPDNQLRPIVSQPLSWVFTMPQTQDETWGSIEKHTNSQEICSNSAPSCSSSSFLIYKMREVRENHYSVLSQYISASLCICVTHTRPIALGRPHWCPLCFT